MRGLHDHRGVEPSLAHARQHAEAVEVGPHQIEHDAVDPGRLIAKEEGKGGIAAIGGQRPVAETLRHGLDQTALHRIVIDDQHDFRHESLPPPTPAPKRGSKPVPIWCSVGDPA